MSKNLLSSKLKVGLALGSGGVRGAAHFGVIRTLLKHGVRISYIAGSSSGSVIGAALAAGRLDEVEDFYRHMNWWRAFRLFTEFSWPFSGGYLTGARVRSALRERLGTVRFEECEIPFTAVAIDMMNGKEFPISSGDLVEGVFASMAVQGLFKPVSVNGHWVADGGLCDPLPIKKCRDMGADFVIAVDVNLSQPLNTQYDPAQRPSIGTIFTQSCRIIENNWTDRILHSNPPDCLLQPDLHDIAAWSFRDVARAILRGKIAAEHMLARLSPDLLAQLT